MFTIAAKLPSCRIINLLRTPSACIATPCGFLEARLINLGDFLIKCVPKDLFRSVFPQSLKEYNCWCNTSWADYSANWDCNESERRKGRQAEKGEKRSIRGEQPEECTCRCLMNSVTVAHNEIFIHGGWGRGLGSAPPYHCEGEK